MIRTAISIILATTALATAASAQPDEFGPARHACRAYLVNFKNVDPEDIRFRDASIYETQVRITGVLRRGSPERAGFTCMVARTGVWDGEVTSLHIHWR
ncbi:MAG TPA: hypothetical protein VG407_12100 [Caulobacteraceae bacterium]|jgi:hypothetical protein|nr:hypothetical protein [Caulobacteraceae bacterium]